VGEGIAGVAVGEWRGDGGWRGELRRRSKGGVVGGRILGLAGWRVVALLMVRGRWAELLFL